MSPLEELTTQLETASHPIAKVLHKGEQFKVIALGFKKGMLLKEHKTPLAAKLTVLKGNVSYKEGEKNVILRQYEEHIIPINIIHSVEANEDSLCLLTQG